MQFHFCPYCGEGPLVAYESRGGWRCSECERVMVIVDITSLAPTSGRILFDLGTRRSTPTVDDQGNATPASDKGVSPC